MFLTSMNGTIGFILQPQATPVVGYQPNGAIFVRPTAAAAAGIYEQSRPIKMDH